MLERRGHPTAEVEARGDDIGAARPGRSSRSGPTRSRRHRSRARRSSPGRPFHGNIRSGPAVLLGGGLFGDADTRDLRVQARHRRGHQGHGTGVDRGLQRLRVGLDQRAGDEKIMILQGLGNAGADLDLPMLGVAGGTDGHEPPRRIMEQGRPRIAELAHRLQDLRPRRLGDGAAAAEHPGDRGQRDPGPGGDLVQRDLHTFQSTFGSRYASAHSHRAENHSTLCRIHRAPELSTP